MRSRFQIQKESTCARFLCGIAGLLSSNLASVPWRSFERVVYWYVKSIGQYAASSPCLWAEYGMSDVLQAFFRRCACLGGITLLDIRLFRAVSSKEGQQMTCELRTTCESELDEERQSIHDVQVAHVVIGPSVADEALFETLGVRSHSEQDQVESDVPRTVLSHCIAVVKRESFEWVPETAATLFVPAPG